MSETVLLERSGAVATVTLNRPEALNPLSKALGAALRERLQEAAADPAIRCIVLTGAGGAFMAGGDLKEFRDTLDEMRDRATFDPLFRNAHDCIRSLRSAPKPVIARVRGPAAGFGLSLVVACDLAVASDNAFFALAYTGIGTSPDGGMSYHLPRLIGARRTLELALLNERFDAATALAMGLVNRVVPDADLDATVDAMATRLASGPTRAYARTKALVNASFDNDLNGQIALEEDAFHHCVMGPDFEEGVGAFCDKRKPGFTGE